jgi:hypothetical protein
MSGISAYERSMRDALVQYRSKPYPETGVSYFHMNLAAWMGEHVGGLFDIIDQLRNHRRDCTCNCMPQAGDAT